MVKAFGISPYILNTSSHVHTIVDTKTSLGVGGFLVTPQASWRPSKFTIPLLSDYQDEASESTYHRTEVKSSKHWPEC